MRGDLATLERDLGYAKRLNLNTTRIWLGHRRYESELQEYIHRLRDYVRTSPRLGSTTMPILWNGNGLDPDILKSEFRPPGGEYGTAIVEAIKHEPGLLISIAPSRSENTRLTRPVAPTDHHAKRPPRQRLSFSRV
jgi:hypothetical protein